MERVSLLELEAALARGEAVFELGAPAVAGAQPLRLEALEAGQLPALPKDAPLYLVCARGQVSELAGLYLEAAGFSAVHHLAGGLKAWPRP